MSRSLDSLVRRIEASLDSPKGASHLLPRLLENLPTLGGSPRRAANWLCAAGIGPKSSVIDLGCGKGAVAIQVARRTGASVIGVDGLPAFVQDACRRAQKAGLHDLCRFECADLLAASKTHPGPFDAAVMTAVLPVLEAAPLLRRLIKRAGLAFVEDQVAPGREPSGPNAPPTAAQVRAALRADGWTIERERIASAAQTRRAEQRIQRVLRRRARQMQSLGSADTRLIREFLRLQRAAAADLVRSRVRGSSWLLRRED